MQFILFARTIRGGASSRRVTEVDMINARIEAESSDMKTSRQLGNVKVRLKPLGTDRDRRRYWLLARGEVSNKQKSWQGSHLGASWSSWCMLIMHLNR